MNISRRAPSEPNAVADVHGGQRQEHAREREQADERDGVRGGAEGQVGRERRHDRRCAALRAEDDVRREAKIGDALLATTASLWKSFTIAR
jgi:hypothetical protein